MATKKPKVEPVYLERPFVITLPIHPTNNNMYVNLPRGGRALSKEAKAWKAMARVAIMVARPRMNPTNQPVCVSIFMHLSCDRDVDSVKALLDAMTGLVYTDDSLIWRLSVSKKQDTADANSSVVVYQYTPEHFFEFDSNVRKAEKE